LLIVCQAVSSITVLCKKREHEDATQRHLRIEAVVEFPLIGFVLMHILLTKEEIQAYTVIDKRQSVENNVVLRLTGAYRTDNIMYTNVKLNSIVYPCCCRGREDLPATVTLAQAIIYPMILPFTKNFWVTMFPSDSNLCTYLLFGPISMICLGFSMASFFMNITFFFVLVVTYADKLYLGRFLSDIPNFSMSISYLLNVEYNRTAALSAAVSLFLTTYYMWSMFLTAITECRRRDDAVVKSTFYEVYGKLSRGQAFSLVVVQPFVMVTCYIFWIPMVFLGCSCFVDNTVSTQSSAELAKDSITKYEMIQVSSEVPVVVTPQEDISSVEAQKKVQDLSIKSSRVTKTDYDEKSKVTTTEKPRVTRIDYDETFRVTRIDND
jgi:hypothetical protein